MDSNVWCYPNRGTCKFYRTFLSLLKRNIYIYIYIIWAHSHILFWSQKHKILIVKVYCLKADYPKCELDANVTLAPLWCWKEFFEVLWNHIHKNHAEFTWFWNRCNILGLSLIVYSMVGKSVFLTKSHKNICLQRTGRTAVTLQSGDLRRGERRLR